MKMNQCSQLKYIPPIEHSLQNTNEQNGISSNCLGRTQFNTILGCTNKNGILFNKIISSN